MSEQLALIRSLTLAAMQTIDGFDCDDLTADGAAIMKNLQAEVDRCNDFLDMHNMATNQCATLKEAEDEVRNARG